MGNYYEIYGFLSSALLKIMASSILAIAFNPVSLDCLHILCSQEYYNPTFLLTNSFTVSINIPPFSPNSNITELNHLQIMTFHEYLVSPS